MPRNQRCERGRGYANSGGSECPQVGQFWSMPFLSWQWLLPSHSFRSPAIAVPGSPHMLNPWIAFSFHAARLGWETQNVIARRLSGIAMSLLGLAGGAAHGRPEQSQIREKIDSLSETHTDGAASVALKRAHTASASATIKRVKGPQVTTEVIKTPKKRGRAKKRRLSK
jgi:hypothetical protein